MYKNKFNPDNGLMNNCSPIPSSPAQFFPDALPCPDCGNNDGTCNCSMSDITYNQDATPCMVSLGIARNMPLAMVLQIYGGAICNLRGDLTCADVAIPGTFLNTGYVGTQYTATWTNPDFTSYPEQFGVFIDGILYNIGTVVNSYYLLLGFNAIGKGVFTINGSTLTAVGFHTYGNVLFAGGDDGQSVPVITGSTTYQSLCDYANAVDDKFGVVDTTLANLQTEINNIQFYNVLYNNTTPVPNPVGGSFETLKSYNLPANYLQNNGDKLVVYSEWIIVNDPDTTIARLAFANTALFSQEISEGGWQLCKMKSTITRVSNTSVSCYTEIGLYYLLGIGATYILDTELTNYISISALNLSVNSYTAASQANTASGGEITNQIFNVDIFKIHP